MTHAMILKVGVAAFGALVLSGCYSRAQLDAKLPDVTEEAIDRRLQLYEEQTVPIIEYYRRRDMLAQVSGIGDGDDVFKRLVKVVDARHSAQARVLNLPTLASGHSSPLPRLAATTRSKSCSQKWASRESLYGRSPRVHK